MKNFFAICPFCKKSIYVEENLSGGYSCPLCGIALGLPYLMENNLIVNMPEAREEYNLAQEYFQNTDFREANKHFQQVIFLNKNDYLAEYYKNLCDIYENELKDDFNLPQSITNSFKISIEKLSFSQVKIADKMNFLSTSLTQLHILLSNHFNKICEKFEKTELWDELRESSLNIAVNLNELILIDKELLMTYDVNISKALINISDLAICGCQKIVQPHLQNKHLNLPTDYEYNKAKTLYNNFYYYAISLDPNYNFNNYKPDYNTNLLYNENVISELNKYNIENKNNEKKYLSTIGTQLDTVVNECKMAIKYSYNTCFKGLYLQKNEQSRIALINESIAFCFETIKPRISIANEKKVDILVMKVSALEELTKYLNAFLFDFSEYSKHLTNDYLNKFYDEILEMVKLYFSIVYNSYNKFVNKLKELQNNEFRYYKNFLYQIVCCSSLALKEVVEYDQHKLNDRIKLLKLGKQVAEEFLLLTDYKIEELEQSNKYSDILHIFNALDDNIKLFSTM